MKRGGMLAIIAISHANMRTSMIDIMGSEPEWCAYLLECSYNAGNRYEVKYVLIHFIIEFKR